MNKHFFIAIGTVLLLSNSPYVMANDPLASEPILDRTFKDFAPIGFRLGTYNIYPYLDTGVEYTDNTLKIDGGSESESLYKGRVGLSAQSIARRSKTLLTGHIERLDYQKTDGFDQVNYKGVVKTEYAISPVAEIGGELNLERKHQTRYETGTTQSAFDPIQIDEYGFITNLILNPGSIKWGLSGEYSNISHQDTTFTNTGTKLVQSDRDRQLYSLSLKAAFEKYSLQGDVGFTPFMGLNMTRTIFDKNNFDPVTNRFSGNNQSNTRYSVTAGMDMRTGGKWRGSAVVGYGTSNPDEGGLDDRGSTVMDIDLTYLYTPLTNFIFGAERFFTDDTNASESSLETRLSAQIVHELTRRWILNTGIAYTNREFGGNIEDDTFETNIGFTHRINNRFSVGGDLKYISRESNQENGDYDETRAMIRLKSNF